MKKGLLFIACIIIACSDGIELPYVDIPKDKYYNSEIIPSKYHNFYGRWRLTSFNGGMTAQTHEPNFDYLKE